MRSVTVFLHSTSLSWRDPLFHICLASQRINNQLIQTVVLIKLNSSLKLRLSFNLTIGATMTASHQKDELSYFLGFSRCSFSWYNRQCSPHIDRLPQWRSSCNFLYWTHASYKEVLLFQVYSSSSESEMPIQSLNFRLQFIVWNFMYGHFSRRHSISKFWNRNHKKSIVSHFEGDALIFFDFQYWTFRNSESESKL